MNKISLLITIVFFFCLSCQRNDQPLKPNIVLINIDDLGWRDFGFMGSEFYQTPNVDSLSKQGMVFTDGYACAANCAPSRACLMSGKWTPRHGIYTVGTSERGRSENRKLIPIENTITLAPEHTVFPEVLKDNGYLTCHVGKWHLSDNPLEYGFDVNIGGGHEGGPGGYLPPYDRNGIKTDDEYLTDILMRKTIEFVESSNSPFFLYYAPYAVHTPIQPVDSLLPKYENKPAWNGQNNIKYATMIDNLDRNIGLLISKLKEKKLFENTLFVLTSDNGGHFKVTKQQPLRAGKGAYYEGGIREPFFFVWTNKIKPGTKNNMPISQLDLFPTLLEVAGVDLSKYEFDGNSILKTLVNDETLEDRPLFWHFPIYLQTNNVAGCEDRDTLFRTRPGSVIRYGDWKLHHYFEDNGIELYNLKEDIGERNDLSKENPEKAEELLNMLNDWRTKTNAPIPTELNPDYKE